jgi:hypothetical protein
VLLRKAVKNLLPVGLGRMREAVKSQSQGVFEAV